jgi:hypothetical protein
MQNSLAWDVIFVAVTELGKWNILRLARLNYPACTCSAFWSSQTAETSTLVELLGNKLLLQFKCQVTRQLSNKTEYLCRTTITESMILKANPGQQFLH